MTNKEAIKYLQQIYPNGGNCWLDEQRIEAIGMAIKALQEEPVSEDLEEAAELYMLNQDTYNSHVEYQIKGAFKAGAKWQKEQDQSTIELAEDHAMLAGMEKMEEEMMAKAFPVEIDSSSMDGRCILCGNFSRFETGDKVKVIVIKK